MIINIPNDHYIEEKRNINQRNLSFSKKLHSRKESIIDQDNSERKVIMSKMQFLKQEKSPEYYPQEEKPKEKVINKYSKSTKSFDNLKKIKTPSQRLGIKSVINYSKYISYKN